MPRSHIEKKIIVIKFAGDKAFPGLEAQKLREREHILTVFSEE